MVKHSKQHCVEVRNRQKKWPMDRSQVHAISLWVAGSLFKDRDMDLSVQFLSSARMAEINQSFLGHEGPTDVITFDQNNLNSSSASLQTITNVASGCVSGTCSHTDASLITNKWYYYRIAAVNGRGTGNVAPAAEVSARAN